MKRSTVIGIVVGTSVLIVGALFAWIGLTVWAGLEVGDLFFSSLGFGEAWDTRLGMKIRLGVIGAVIGVVLALPYAIWIAPRTGCGLLGSLSRWVGSAVIVTGAVATLVPVFVGQYDAVLAALHAVGFGVTDPVFGEDVRFFVFTVPAVLALVVPVWAVLIAPLVVSGLVAIGTAVQRSDWEYRQTHRNVSTSPASRVMWRALRLTAIYGGLWLIVGGIAYWWWRYTAVAGSGDDLIAGASRSTVEVSLPTSTVIAGFIIAAGAAVMALGIPGISGRLGRISLRTWAFIGAGVWIATTIALAVVATPWWLVLLVGGILLAVAAAKVPSGTVQKDDADTASESFAMQGIVAGFLFVSCLIAVLFAPVGSALYDGLVLRGSVLQSQRTQIEQTLTATRTAAGVDTVTSRPAGFARGGVTQEAIDAAPSSVASVRFLDYMPVISACNRLQAFNRFYHCDDADLDRYETDGVGQPMFVLAREVNYEPVGDFQRRHFAFTHGRGVAMAPVNRIDAAGRPDFVVQGLDSEGLPEPLTRPEIYFGAQPDMPWAVVNTTQPDGFTNRPAPTWKGDGIPIEGNQLALTVDLGGLPFIGGGRRFWNAVKRSETPETEVLLHRSMDDRMRELVPFLGRDHDPYFVAAGGELWVMQNLYTHTDRYPYAAERDGVNYQRHAAVGVMNAYSGATTIYVLDPGDPIIRTWQAVYPSLFASKEQLPAALAPHLRYGEQQFDYQSAILGRFHVDDVDAFFNNDQGWSFTTETTGSGVQGDRIVSPARFTYAKLPGQAQEQFLLARYFKPATEGRGIGFSAWLSADNDLEDFGALTLLEFPQDARQPLESVDTFASNIARDPTLSEELGVRKDSVLRGNVIVVPVGKGLLYVQPLYLDSSADSLPTLWQVVVSFGDGRVYAAPTFAEALEEALIGASVPGDGGSTELSGDIKALVREAAAAYERYQVAWREGRYEDATRELRRFEQLLEAAQAKATP